MICATPAFLVFISLVIALLVWRYGRETVATTREVATLAGRALRFARLPQAPLDQGVRPLPIEWFRWGMGIGMRVVVAGHTMISKDSGRAATSALLYGTFTRRAGVPAALMTTILLAACGGTTAYSKVEAGNHAFAHSQFAQALAAYSGAKQLAPNDSIVQYDIGNTLHQLQRYDEAAASSKTAATETQDGTVYARATYAIGNDAFRRGLLMDARDAYVAVLQRDPTDNDARHNLEVVLGSLQASPSPPGEDQSGAQPSNTPPTGNTPGPNDSTQRDAPPQATPPGTNDGQQQNAEPGTGASSAEPDAEAAARAQLQQALKNLTGTVTPEDALRILDAERQASEQDTLTRPGATNPNDR